MAQHINGHEPEDGEQKDNVIRIETLAERDRARKEQERALQKAAAGPIFNMPPVTKYLMGLMMGVFILTHLILSPEKSDWVIEHLGFVPADFTEGSFTLFTIPSLVTHAFLHGGWMHIIMNMFMLAAFGSGVERWLGAKRMLILFFLSAFFGAAFHYLLNMGSTYPMIGASGGLSGLFAAAIVMLSHGQREMGGRFGMLPFALLWIGLSIGFGMLGGPDGSTIAWAAHVGGFLGGFLILKAMRVQ